jgi:hypothetical protein
MTWSPCQRPKHRRLRHLPQNPHLPQLSLHLKHRLLQRQHLRCHPLPSLSRYQRSPRLPNQCQCPRHLPQNPHLPQLSLHLKHRLLQRQHLRCHPLPSPSRYLRSPRLPNQCQDPTCRP